MIGIETAASKILGRAAVAVYGRAQLRQRNRRTRATARPAAARKVAMGFLAELTGAELAALNAYDSSDDEEVAVRLVLGRTLQDVTSEKLALDIPRGCQRTRSGCVVSASLGAQQHGSAVRAGVAEGNAFDQVR